MITQKQNTIVLTDLAHISNNRVTLPKKICDKLGLKNKSLVSIVNVRGNKCFDINKYDPEIQYSKKFGFIREVATPLSISRADEFLQGLDTQKTRQTICQLLDNDTIRVSLC